jgi:hypothetical protein
MHNRFKNYEAGRLAGNLSRPQSKASENNPFDYGSGKSSITYHDEKSGNISVADSQEAINMDECSCSHSTFTRHHHFTNK